MTTKSNSAPFRFKLEFFDYVKRNISMWPEDSTLRKLFYDNRSEFWYIMKRWAWFAHGEQSREIMTADLRQAEEFTNNYLAWQETNQLTPFHIYYRQTKEADATR